jgi:hypothetical protein
VVAARSIGRIARTLQRISPTVMSSLTDRRPGVAATPPTWMLARGPRSS